ncbi:hypothetical protein PGT21_027742 [Puccinia graminis f. sp. tritici]|uniref:Uncharacterized protein n=1 Tax=Puccinia graminis f. sp. tritici TaxID=56615 RepID=A0A5B0MY51_PUCGR|nr:hypothetical protein PGT21_027742 [Puccinia graminis f. sp. tritici]
MTRLPRREGLDKLRLQPKKSDRSSVWMARQSSPLSSLFTAGIPREGGVIGTVSKWTAGDQSPHCCSSQITILHICILYNHLNQFDYVVDNYSPLIYPSSIALFRYLISQTLLLYTTTSFSYYQRTKSSKMLYQNRILMIALFIIQLVIVPIQALPSSQPPSSGTNYSDLDDKAPSHDAHQASTYGPTKGKLREESSHRGDATCKSFEFCFPIGDGVLTFLFYFFKTTLLDWAHVDSRAVIRISL